MFNPKASTGSGFMMYNNANIDWYVRMPTDPLPVDLKIEVLSEQYKEEGATLELTFPMIDNWLPH